MYKQQRTVYTLRLSNPFKSKHHLCATFTTSSGLGGGASSGRTVTILDGAPSVFNNSEVIQIKFQLIVYLKNTWCLIES